MAGLLAAGPSALFHDLVVDMEAGLEHLSRGTTRHVGVLLAVAEPYFRSMETARRICDLATELGIPEVRLVANKVRDGTEAEALEAFASRHRLPLAARIDYDDAVRLADLAGRPLLEHAGPGSPAVRAITGLAEALVDGRA
jgi:CO dehydrogenase maturation factor